MFRKARPLHFVGVGGTGMSGIAEVLVNLGYAVSGSDVVSNPATRRLKRRQSKSRWSMGRSVEPMTLSSPCFHSRLPRCGSKRSFGHYAFNPESVEGVIAEPLSKAAESSEQPCEPESPKNS